MIKHLSFSQRRTITGIALVLFLLSLINLIFIKSLFDLDSVVTFVFAILLLISIKFVGPSVEMIEEYRRNE